ncbi:MAG TPA: Plug domain-containing protein, partial [Rubricoccaceae bacterium]
MRFRFLGSAALLLVVALASAVGARAQGAPGSPAGPVEPDTLGTVTVSAARVAVDTHEAPVHAVVVGREALDDAAARSVADALAARTPVVVRRYGPGGLASVSVRGSGAQQTLVLLDGLPLSDPQLGQVDLSLLPAALVESVEVVAGAASGLYGSGALGGVVGLTTGGPSGVRASAEAGAWGERRLSARAVGGRGAFQGVVAAEASRSDGDYAVPDPTLLGAPRVRREGFDTRQTSVYAAARAAGRHGRAGLSLWAADAA